MDVESAAIEAPPRVLIWAASGVGQSRLADMLRGIGAIVTDAAGGEMPELIVVDGDAPVASAHAAVADPADRPGLIAIGESNPTDADVTLPADFTLRELGLACRLLAQVVRLRRRLHAGARQGDAWRQEAACDALTQLPNRRAWDEELARRLKAARSSAQAVCVALVDLDHFKQVNDGWGHAAGDQLLIATAAALRQSLRQEDFVARLGGDEFGLILAGLDAGGAPGVVERVRVELPARIARSTPHVTSASVGYGVFDGSTDISPAQLLAHADRARRLAKTQGRDRSVSA